MMLYYKSTLYVLTTYRITLKQSEK